MPEDGNGADRLHRRRPRGRCASSRSGTCATRSRSTAAIPASRTSPTSLEDGDGVVEYDGVEYAFDPWITGIASAQTPEEILVALYTSASASSPNGLLQQLGDLLLHQDAELPGELAAPDCD